MKVYCVVDTLGAGRIVGIFTSGSLAAEVAAIEPHYYQLEEAELDAINPAALDWAQTVEQRERLQQLIARK